MTNPILMKEPSEAAPSKAEQRLRAQVEAVGAVSWFCAPSGLVVEPQPGWMAFTGQTAEEALGEGWTKAVHPKDLASMLLKWREAVARAEPHSTEIRVRRHDGQWRWMSVRVAPVRDESGEIVEWCGMNIDITERKQAEATLRANEERFRLFMDNSPAIGWMKDEDGRHVYFSRTFERRFGAQAADWLGRTDSELWPPEVAEEFRRNDLKVLKAGHPIEIVEEMQEPDGGRSYWLSTKFPFRDAAGKRYVGGIGLDITEPKQMEEALRASERLFRGIFKHQLAYSALLSPEGHLIDASDVALRATGVALEDIIGVDFLDGPWWRDLPEVRACWRRQFQEALARRGPSRDEIEYRTGDGLLRHALNSVTALHDEQGELEYFLCEGLDITERKQAEEALRDADRAKDEFLATLSHELRNPLASIRNGLDGLRKLGAHEPSVDHLLASMDGQADHLTRLVDDLMNVSRISRGKLELQKKRIELAATLEQAVGISRHLFEAKNLGLHLHLFCKPAPVDGDAVRLTQVFDNLLSNAAKYTKSGGRVQITLERNGNEASVSVADTGDGIPTELLPRIFDPFVQGDGKGDRLKQGLGIGLALARKITEMHGGAVEAQSEGEGLGSTFTLRLPLIEDATASAPALDTSSAPKPVQAGRRVLVIDDLCEVAEALAFLLKVLGAEVRVAHSGAEGLAICAEFEPELVFLDLSMSEMDGFETARRMRKFDAGRRSKLVALTGFGEERTRERTLEAGFDDHLPKPARLGQIEELLASVSAETA